MQSTILRADLETLPTRMRDLPVRRGYPVPWFVEWIENGHGMEIGKGEPDFRVMSGRRFALAVRERRCWVCGKVIHGTSSCFVIGPMCAVNRTSAEPPSHQPCAEWSARNCPFLSRPHARRRDAGLPETGEVAGIMLERNPGVTCVWRSANWFAHYDNGPGILFNIGDPNQVSWWAEGRTASTAEVLASIESGLPALRELAEPEGDEAVAELERCVERALAYVP